RRQPVQYTSRRSHGVPIPQSRGDRGAVQFNRNLSCVFRPDQSLPGQRPSGAGPFQASSGFTFIRPFVHPLGLIWVVVLVVPLQAQTPQIPAKANQPSALGLQIEDAERIVVLEVDKADRERGTISYKKVKDLKGNGSAERVEHRLGAEFPKREWQ